MLQTCEVSSYRCYFQLTSEKWTIQAPENRRLNDSVLHSSFWIRYTFVRYRRCMVWLVPSYRGYIVARRDHFLEEAHPKSCLHGDNHSPSSLLQVWNCRANLANVASLHLELGQIEVKCGSACRYRVTSINVTLASHFSYSDQSKLAAYLGTTSHLQWRPLHCEVDYFHLQPPTVITCIMGAQQVHLLLASFSQWNHWCIQMLGF